MKIKFTLNANVNIGNFEYPNFMCKKQTEKINFCGIPISV